MLMAVCHSAADGWVQVEDLSKLSDLRDMPGNLLWAETDIVNLTPDDVETIAEEFELSELAVEDSLHIRQRPKIESYENHLFIVFHQLDEIEGQLEPSQIACFIGERDLLVLHAGAARTLEKAKSRWEESRDRLDEGVSYLTYTLMDVIVDDYQEIADRLEDEVEQLEEIVLEAPTAPVQEQLYRVKQRTARLRRFVFPMQRVLAMLLGPDHGARFTDDVRELFRDVEDHILRIADQVRNVEDLSDAAIDLRRSAQATALNETTKKLTGWAAIIAVPTLITGVYGMNVGILPPDGSRAGFWGILAFILVESLFLYWYFKHRDWI